MQFQNNLVTSVVFIAGCLQDLVKAHLMLAVRAEIEELKEQIKQLMVKNQQLEYENNILRAAAKPELVASLDSAVVDLDFDNGS